MRDQWENDVVGTLMRCIQQQWIKNNITSTVNITSLPIVLVLTALQIWASFNRSIHANLCSSLMETRAMFLKHPDQGTNRLFVLVPQTFVETGPSNNSQARQDKNRPVLFKLPPHDATMQSVQRQ